MKMEVDAKDSRKTITAAVKVSRDINNACIIIHTHACGTVKRTQIKGLNDFYCNVAKTMQGGQYSYICVILHANGYEKRVFKAT